MDMIVFAAVTQVAYYFAATASPAGSDVPAWTAQLIPNWFWGFSSGRSPWCFAVRTKERRPLDRAGRSAPPENAIRRAIASRLRVGRSHRG
jgi:hypothetical protein